MQHTIAAVFERQNQAEQAIDDLVASGFSRDLVRLSQSLPEPAGRERDETSLGGSIKSFFSDIFGSASHPDTELYSEAVRQGHYVLTLDVADDDLVERATDVLERHGPIDIDDEASKWRAGGAWSGAAGTHAAPPPPSAQGGAAQQSSMQSAAAPSQSQGGATAIHVIQEALKVGKRAVERGGVRVFRRLVETPVHERVSLREENVTVERHPVDQPASAADLAAFQEGSFEVRETAEEPVVEKVARVVEEVVIGKQVTQREQQIDDTVRSTEVEVEQLSGSGGRSTTAFEDDAYFRRHWNSHYAGAGGSYDDYESAYRYGAALGERYGGRRWDDIEPDVQRGWEAQHGGSAWAKFKDAVRHGWERITS